MMSVIPARSNSGMLGESEPRAGLVSAPEGPTLTGGVTAAQPGQIPGGTPDTSRAICGQVPGRASGRSGADPRAEPRANPAQMPEQTWTRPPGTSHPRADAREPRAAAPGRQQRRQPRWGGELEAGTARGSPGPRAAVYKRCGVLGRGPVTLARGRGRGGDGGFRSLRRPGLQQLRRRPWVSGAGSSTRGSPRSWDGSGEQYPRPGEAGARPQGPACPAPQGWRAGVAGGGRCLWELLVLVLPPARPPPGRGSAAPPAVADPLCAAEWGLRSWGVPAVPAPLRPAPQHSGPGGSGAPGSGGRKRVSLFPPSRRRVQGGFREVLGQSQGRPWGACAGPGWAEGASLKDWGRAGGRGAGGTLRPRERAALWCLRREEMGGRALWCLRSGSAGSRRPALSGAPGADCKSLILRNRACLSLFAGVFLGAELQRQ